MLRVYAHNSIKSATEFIEEVRRRLPMAIQRIQTDHASEFGTDFTWHLRDLGVIHRQIPRGYPQANGKGERSHRTDEDEFYRRVIFRTPAELASRDDNAGRAGRAPPRPPTLVDSRGSEAEKLEITAGLLGFDAQLPDRLRRTAVSLAELLALLDQADEAEGWLRRRLKDLE